MRTMRRPLYAVLSLAFLAVTLVAQRPLTHDDYDSWQSIRGQAFSRDGAWAAFAINPAQGDGTLHVRSTDGKTSYTHARGGSPRFTPDGRFVVFRIEPTFADKRAHEWKQLEKGGKRGAGAARGARAGRGRGRGRFGRGSRRASGPLTGSSGSSTPGPKPEFAIMTLADGKVEMLDQAAGFLVPDEGYSYLVYKLRKPENKDDEKGDDESEQAGRGRRGNRGERGRRGGGRAGRSGASASEEGEEGEGEEDEKDKTPKYLKDGTVLVLRDLTSGKETRIEGVTDYGMTRKSGWTYFVTSSKPEKNKNGKEEGEEGTNEAKPAAKATAKEIHRGLHAIHLASGKRKTLVEGAANFKGFSLDREEERFAFFSDRQDRDADKPNSDLYVWDFKAARARRLVDLDTPGMPAERRVATGSNLQFSRDGEVMLFGVEPLPEPDLRKVLPSEKVVLDLWHYKDPLLQPMQAAQKSRLSNKALRSAWHFEEDRMVVFGQNPQENVSFLTPDGSVVLVQDGLPYAQLVSWDTSYNDVYVTNTLSGKARKVLTKIGGQVRGSQTGRYLLYFEDQIWQRLDLGTGEHKDLTADLGVAFHNVLHDSPSVARPYGIAGFTEGDQSVLLHDRYDLWKVALDGSGATCVTDGYGRAEDITLRYLSLDPDADFVSGDEPILLSALDQESMAAGFFSDRLDGMAKPRKLVMKNVSFGRGAPTKAKNADRLFFTMSTFRQSPDLWTADLEFKGMKKLSSLNPQQRGIRWGAAELVNWRSADGAELKGFLIKPDGFDPNKKYPMMVYFYERMSSQIHSYRNPAPGTSPTAPYYVSNGYLWFVPDIHYRIGYPGESAVKCIISGVQHLMAKGFVDEDAVGAAGHSWGGYQTAYMVTQSDIFKAVESGAPVSNMTSAYGGIRWQSGMSRAFQYERTQSRIGGSLWEYPMRYLENSPLFFADKVNTPVLMLHNDKDGAVPWYQGIEYFNALRRLGKEVYMFNYVGEPHGLRKRQNMKDWTRRMQEYFDHHLRGKPMPDWMAHGVAYIDREREKIDYDKPSKEPKKKKKKAEITEPVGSSGSRGNR